MELRATQKPVALLVNPPSRRIVFRDHYHSQISKSDYVWHPNDLLIQSGFLAREFEVRLLDAVAERRGFAQAVRMAVSVRPALVFSLVGSASEEEDRSFLARLRERLPEAVFVGAGDVVQFPRGDPFEAWPMLDGVLNYVASPSLTDFFHRRVAADVRVRGAPSPGRPRGRTFSYPTPALDQFLTDRYRLPFYDGRPFHSTMLSLGCPFQCRFCVVKRFPVQVRDLDSVFEELDQVAARGVHNLWVRDASFGYDRAQARAFCEGLIARGAPFRWNAFTRADFLDDEMVSLLVRSGCFMVHLGVEAPSDEVLRAEKKNLSFHVLREAFLRCRRAGLKTSAHFVLGLTADDGRHQERYRAAVRELRPDLASFNVFQGRPGLAEDALERAARAAADPSLPGAQRELTRWFYLRPQVIASQATQLRSLGGVKRLAASAAAVLRSKEAMAGYRPEPTVSLVRCSSYRAEEVSRSLEAMLAPFGGVKALGRPGETILVKPNMLRSAKPESAVVTHPEVVRACVRALRDAGARPLVGDLPAYQEGVGPVTASRRAGYFSVCEEERVEWVNLAQDGFRKVEVLPGLEVGISERALTVDRVLSLAKVKTHVFTGGTGAVKNLFGCVAPSDRRRLHGTLSSAEFARVVAAIARALPLGFAISDGIVGMEGSGPGQGTPRQLGLLLGSTDLVALDRMSARVSGMDRRPQPVLDAAARLGLGEGRVEDILVVGEDPAAVRVPFRLPPPLHPAIGTFITQLHFRTFTLRPRIDPKRCQKCEMCMSVCPVDAIAMEPTPRIDADQCVSCFCCHEVCTHGAIEERYGGLGQLWRLARHDDRAS